MPGQVHRTILHILTQLITYIIFVQFSFHIGNILLWKRLALIWVYCVACNTMDKTIFYSSHLRTSKCERNVKWCKDKATKKPNEVQKEKKKRRKQKLTVRSRQYWQFDSRYKNQYLLLLCAPTCTWRPEIVQNSCISNLFIVLVLFIYCFFIFIFISLFVISKNEIKIFENHVSSIKCHVHFYDFLLSNCCCFWFFLFVAVVVVLGLTQRLFAH